MGGTLLMADSGTLLLAIDRKLRPLADGEIAMVNRFMPGYMFF